MGLLTAIKNAKREHKEQKPITQTLRIEHDAVLHNVYPEDEQDFASRYAFVGIDEDGMPVYRLRGK
jgi:hypothetical protein